MSAPQPQQTPPKRRYIRQRLTPETAGQFDRFSPQNAAIVRNTLSCDCQPYTDVYTYNRWQEFGLTPAEGSKAAVYVPTRATRYFRIEGDPETDPETVHADTRPTRAALFCRCQVVPRDRNRRRRRRKGRR